MNIKGLIGYNAFCTANNICGALRLYKAGVREMEDIVNGIRQMNFIGLDDLLFAKDLINALIDNIDKQEELVEAFFMNYLEGVPELQAIDIAISQVKSKL